MGLFGELVWMDGWEGLYRLEERMLCVYVAAVVVMLFLRFL